MCRRGRRNWPITSPALPVIPLFGSEEIRSSADLDPPAVRSSRGVERLAFVGNNGITETSLQSSGQGQEEFVLRLAADDSQAGLEVAWVPVADW